LHATHFYFLPAHNASLPSDRDSEEDASSSEVSDRRSMYSKNGKLLYRESLRYVNTHNIESRDAISLDRFSDMLQTLRDPAAFVKAALSGDFDANHVSIYSDDVPDTKMFHDVDSIGIYSSSIPVSPSGRVIINTTTTHDVNGTTSKNHVGVKLPGDDQYTEICDVPNYMFGRFGDLGRFSVSYNLLHIHMSGLGCNIHTHTSVFSFVGMYMFP
jgi:hypothetical protein